MQIQRKLEWEGLTFYQCLKNEWKDETEVVSLNVGVCDCIGCNHREKKGNVYCPHAGEDAQ